MTERILDWSDVERPEYPRNYMLDTGNVCNLRCPFCQTGRKVPGIARGLMSRATFDAILEKIGPHARFISMVNWGEPFLNKDVTYFFSRCRERGIRTHVDSALSTKAWTAEEAEAIVSSGLSSLLASIDGTTQEVYERYRVHGNLAMALENLRALRAARERMRMSAPFLGWAFYLSKYNEHQVDEACAMAKGLGIPIWFKLLTCDDPSWQSSYHSRLDDPVLATPEWLPHVYPDWRAPSIIEKPLHPAIPMVCVLPFSFIVINWNGDAYPCDTVYGEKYRLGNLVTQSLEEVWHGRAYVSCRSFLRNYGPEQDSGSVCQDRPCSLVRKWLPVAG